MLLILTTRCNQPRDHTSARFCETGRSPSQDSERACDGNRGAAHTADANARNVQDKEDSKDGRRIRNRLKKERKKGCSDLGDLLFLHFGFYLSSEAGRLNCRGLSFTGLSASSRDFGNTTDRGKIPSLARLDHLQTFLIASVI